MRPSVFLIFCVRKGGSDMEYRAQESSSTQGEEKVKVRAPGLQRRLRQAEERDHHGLGAGAGLRLRHSLDASAVPGFGGEVRSDLFLHPDPATLAEQPWRPENGQARADVLRRQMPLTAAPSRPTAARSCAAPSATPRPRAAASPSAQAGVLPLPPGRGSEPTRIPYDRAGYMDIAPRTGARTSRREICLTLEQMGIRPESSHHQEGPSQNEIDFRYLTLSRRRRTTA